MRLARVYNPGTPLEMPHLIFVIDRRQANRIYYINTPRYVLHEQFARREGLAPKLDKATLISQYKDPKRRFLFGTLSWQRDLPGYTYEFWKATGSRPSCSSRPMTWCAPRSMKRRASRPTPRCTNRPPNAPGWPS